MVGRLRSGGPRHSCLRVCLSERGVACVLVRRRDPHRAPPMKAGIAMFFKIIASLLTAVLGYFVIQNDFDLNQAQLFPAAARIRYFKLLDPCAAN